MLRDFTSVQQSDFDITNTAISNNPFSSWTPTPTPKKLGSRANYISGPWHFRVANAPLAP